MRFAAAQGLLGRRQRDRAEVVDPGQRVAAVDEVAQVPVAATRQRREPRCRERPPASAAGRDRDEPDDQHCRRQQEVELGPGSQPAARPTTASAPADSASSSAVPLRPGIQGNGNGGEQEEDPDDVVPRLPGLVGEGGHAERDRPRAPATRRRPGTGRPMHQHGDQASREPAEIQQRREQVPPERQHPHRVEDFAVRRVEPGQELRRDEVQVHRVAALEEPRRERPVVPGAVEPGHPGRQPRLRSSREVDYGDERDGEGRPPSGPTAPAPRVLSRRIRDGARSSRPPRGAEPPATPPAEGAPRDPSAAPTSGDDAKEIRQRLEHANGAEQLRDPDQRAPAPAPRSPGGPGAPAKLGAAGAHARLDAPSQAKPTSRASSATPSR